LAVKGVTLDLDITQVGQGVVGGGKSGAWEYGGRGDLILDLDSGGSDAFLLVLPAALGARTENHK